MAKHHDEGMQVLAPTRIRARAAALAAVVVALLAVYPGLSAAAALASGIGIALTVGNPWASRTRALAQRALAWSVVGLGAGMNLASVARVGLHGAGYTLVGITAALLLGGVLGRRLGVRGDTSLLITVGTAICGGSAIAAVAPTIGAKDEDTSVALATVFALNAVALFAFPVIGHRLGLGQRAFGLWSALAIHDTSSVVGAASQYGQRALEVATSAKLARALWIVPLTFVMEARRRGAKSSTTTTKPKRPWFILAFLAAAALVTFCPVLQPAGRVVAAGAHRLLAVALFLMGTGFSRPALASAGARPILLGVALWSVLALGTLGAILAGLVA
jgi:uncharacterized integral membrane protein (TIGR00698 family)